MTHPMRLCFGLGMVVLITGSAFAAPPITEPVDVIVNNPVLPVEVSNADPIPVSLGDQGTPFIYSFYCGKIGENSVACPSYQLPADQRAVIEQASGTCSSAGTKVINVAIRTATGNEYHYHSLPSGLAQLDTSDPTETHYSFSGLMRVYADAGAYIQSRLTVDDIYATQYSCTWTISGLLFTVP